MDSPESDHCAAQQIFRIYTYIHVAGPTLNLDNILLLNWIYKKRIIVCGCWDIMGRCLCWTLINFLGIVIFSYLFVVPLSIIYFTCTYIYLCRQADISFHFYLHQNCIDGKLTKCKNKLKSVTWVKVQEWLKWLVRYPSLCAFWTTTKETTKINWLF